MVRAGGEEGEFSSAYNPSPINPGPGGGCDDVMGRVVTRAASQSRNDRNDRKDRGQRTAQVIHLDARGTDRHLSVGYSESLGQKCSQRSYFSYMYILYQLY